MKVYELDGCVFNSFIFKDVNLFVKVNKENSLCYLVF